jgi:epoxyqueuosine reductase
MYYVDLVMTQPTKTDTLHILKKAKSIGASLAGIASVSELQISPSHKSFGAIQWPSRGESLLVLALEHNKNDPDMDWWGVEDGTSGNRLLKNISMELKTYLYDEFNEKAWLLQYQPGVFLKDAAVLAGVGIMGINNLLVTPEYGPRIRLRVLLIESEFAPTCQLEYSPCDSCNHACWHTCPQDAFTSGKYDRERCQRQMAKDEKNRMTVKNEKQGESVISIVKYCRACEFACPIGNR